MANEFSSTIKRLAFLIENVPPAIRKMPFEEISEKLNPAKWSKKEILGHLCDSAINNLSRFIKGQFETKPFEVIKYDQDEWVKAAHYNEMPPDDVISFWVSANRNILNVIKYYSPQSLAFECFMNGGDFGNYTAKEIPGYNSPNGSRTLHWLIDDYVAHIEYHMKQILEFEI